MTEESLKKGNLPLAISEAEEYILEVFHDPTTQERIKQQMRQALQKELAGMSELLREAIQNWVKKEKGKAQQEGPAINELKEQEQVLLLEKLESFEVYNKRLEAENKIITRKLELKEHENKIMTMGVQKMMKSKR